MTPRYYGTAVPVPSEPAPAPTPAAEVVWCELAGCPALECVGCREAALERPAR